MPMPIPMPMVSAQIWEGNWTLHAFPTSWPLGDVLGYSYCYKVTEGSTVRFAEVHDVTSSTNAGMDHFLLKRVGGTTDDLADVIADHELRHNASGPGVWRGLVIRYRGLTSSDTGQLPTMPSWTQTDFELRWRDSTSPSTYTVAGRLFRYKKSSSLDSPQFEVVIITGTPSSSHDIVEFLQQTSTQTPSNFLSGVTGTASVGWSGWHGRPFDPS